MSSTLIHSQVQPRPATSAAARQLWQRGSEAIWRVLEDLGRSRAQDELRRLALSHQATNPTLARKMREALLQIS